MAQEHSRQAGPDLTEGIVLAELADGAKLVGHVGENQVLLVRRGADIFAIGAECTHYGGPLADGLVVDDTIRCPWHHACFDLRTGEALRAPALSPVACWSVEARDGKVFVGEKRPSPGRKPRGGTAQTPEKIVIVGGGAAGFAAALGLRREQYQGSIVMLSNDEALPIDRPNLSKDYLAGTAPEAWLPLRRDAFYAKNGIDLRLGVDVAGIDPGSREVKLADGSSVTYDQLLLATGAEPVRLSIPGADLPHVRTLRSLADCKAIIELAGTARRAVVHGRELHRARSRGIPARPGNRRPCGGARQTADGAHPRRADGRFHPRAARGARRRLPPRGHRERHRQQAGAAQRR